MSTCSYPVLNNFSITVLKGLGALKINKSPGPDEIFPIVLKEMKEVISKPLTKIMQQSVDTGVVATDWRIANVIPSHKKGDKTKPGNYRTISLTSIIIIYFLADALIQGYLQLLQDITLFLHTIKKKISHIIFTYNYPFIQLGFLLEQSR